MRLPQGNSSDRTTLKAGMDYSRSAIRRPRNLSSCRVGRLFGPGYRANYLHTTNSFGVHQNEAAFYVVDEWTPVQRVTFTLGLRSDTDSVTDSTHVAPRGGVMLALTKDGKTLLKGGGGIFYDRVPLCFRCSSLFLTAPYHCSIQAAE